MHRFSLRHECVWHLVELLLRVLHSGENLEVKHSVGNLEVLHSVEKLEVLHSVGEKPPVAPTPVLVQPAVTPANRPDHHQPFAGPPHGQWASVGSSLCETFFQA